MSKAYSDYERQKISKEEYTNYSVNDSVKITNDEDSCIIEVNSYA